MALALAAATLLTVLPGCGDGSDEESTPVDSAERADFIATADGICEATGAEIQAQLVQRLPEGGDQDRDDLLAFLTEVTLPGLENQYEEIGALIPPAGEEEEVQAIVEAADGAIAEAEADPSLLLVTETQPTPFDEVNALQQDFGFEVCGAD